MPKKEMSDLWREEVAPLTLKMDFSGGLGDRRSRPVAGDAAGFSFRPRQSANDDLIDFYLGISRTPGALDKRYPDCIDGIYHYTDSCIFYSKKLCEDLINHGHKQVQRWKRSYRDDAPLINAIDFKSPELVAILPDEKEYESWLSGYKTL